MVKKTTEVEKTEEVDNQSTPSVPMKLRYNVITPNGKYVVKRPTGRAGVIHFTLVTKAIPTSTDENGKVILSPADQERFTSAFDEWSQKVLPLIYIEGPDGIKVEEMPGEDQYALFLAMFSTVNLNHKDLFRFVD
jgi:hypothetical protein